MKTLRVALLGFAMLALALPAPAQKDKKSNKDEPEVAEADKFLKPGQISGKAMSVTETSLQLRVEYQHLELKDNLKTNPGNAAALARATRLQGQIAQAQQRLQNARTQRQSQLALQQLQRLVQQAQAQAVQDQLTGRNNPYKVVTDYKDFNIELSGKVEFRVSNPSFLAGLQFDDMGNPKKFTAEELKELKGKENKPGYKATSTDVKPGAGVIVTLAKDKEAENKLRGMLVLVTEQGQDELTTDKKGGKKKNK